MRYTLSINQSKCIEWKLNLAQGALMDLINQASSWAEQVIKDGEVYYWVSRNKVIAEIPAAYEKPDTVYRSLKVLKSKGLISYIKEGKKDLVKMTAKGMQWNVAGTIQGDTKLGNKSELDQNSEINPRKLGNKSEFNSEINPTNNNTNINNNTNNNNSAFKPKKPESVSDEVWNDLLAHRKAKKTSNTKTAWSAIYNQLDKAHQATGHSLDQIISEWLARDWKGFKSDWYINVVNSNSKAGGSYATHQPDSKKSHFDQLREEAAAKYGGSVSSIRTVN